MISGLPLRVTPPQAAVCKVYPTGAAPLSKWFCGYGLGPPPLNRGGWSCIGAVLVRGAVNAIRLSVLLITPQVHGEAALLLQYPVN